MTYLNEVATIRREVFFMTVFTVLKNIGKEDGKQLRFINGVYEDKESAIFSVTMGKEGDFTFMCNKTLIYSNEKPEYFEIERFDTVNFND